MVRESSSEPTFSVCIPTHNAAATLEPAIRSVLAQTFGDFELIITDDRGVPATLDVVKKFSDPRVSYHRISEARHASDNWAASFRLARGKYLLLLGDDDGLVPTALERVRDAFSIPARPGIVLTGSFRYEHPVPSARTAFSGGNYLNFRSFTGAARLVDSVDIARTLFDHFFPLATPLDPASPARTFPEYHPTCFFLTREVYEAAHRASSPPMVRPFPDVGFASFFLETPTTLILDAPLGLLGHQRGKATAGNASDRRRYDVYNDPAVAELGMGPLTFQSLLVASYAAVAKANPKAMSLLASLDAKDSCWIGHGCELLLDRNWDRKKLRDWTDFRRRAKTLGPDRSGRILRGAWANARRALPQSAEPFTTLARFARYTALRAARPTYFDTRVIDGQRNGFSDLVSVGPFVESKLMPPIDLSKVADQTSSARLEALPSKKRDPLSAGLSG